MATWKDFNKTFGGIMEWNTKLLGHINSNHTDRVIDYLLSYLDYNDPVEFGKNYKNFRDGDEDGDKQIEFEAVEYLKNKGYKLGTRYLENHQSKELCIFAPNDTSKYWHSRYYEHKDK